MAGKVNQSLVKALGLIAVSSKTGLGYQTRDYYRHLKPQKTLVVDISSINNTTQNPDWYPDATFVKGFPQPKQIEQFLQGLDVVLTAETPYNFELFTLAKQKGVKTICVENPEFYDYFKYPQLPMPDKIILPSTWLEAEIRNHAEPKGVEVVQLHHPVDRLEFPFTLRTKPSYLHIAGNPAVNDRNGTFMALNVKDITITIQKTRVANFIKSRYKARVVEPETRQQLYTFGDVLVLPRRYGGNCLPLNEALSSGLPVIMPDISPNNILPKNWLVPAYKDGYFEPRAKIDLYSVDKDKLLETVYNLDIEKESKIANEIADTISWQTLLPKWKEAVCC